jgi:L-fuconolactonase
VLIDAHQHFWRVGQNGFLLADAGPGGHPPRLRSGSTWRRSAGPLGLAGSVLVQSQPDDRDTDWLLALAADEPLVLGVVGWVDLRRPTPRLASPPWRNPKLRGLRPMLQTSTTTPGSPRRTWIPRSTPWSPTACRWTPWS